MDIPSEVRSAGYEAIDTYKKALPHGERWALMCALQTAPGTKGTERAFMQGRNNNEQLDGMPPLSAKWMVKEAKGAGINISGKYYCGGIADSRGWKDPQAWVSSNDDVLRVAQNRRLAVSGSVNYDPGTAPPKRVKLSERIIKEEVAKERRTNPGADAKALREKVIDKYAYKAKGR